MKKEMLFKIGLVNKSSVQTVKDTTTFYTSDTELWLGFELLETELIFDSAEILLLNKDDRSFIVRSVKQEQGKYWYELESDIIAHHGEWLGQLLFNKGEEAFTSKKFGFRIENDLSNDRPPQLTEVNNWKNLRAIAHGLIDDLRSELELFAEKELEIDKAESERQTTFETAEQSRQSAELIRVENEKERVLNYENMKDTIDMIGKVKLANLVINGDFSNGIVNWSNNATQSTLTVENDNLKVTYTTKVDNLYLANVNQVVYKDNMYYSIVRFNPVNLKGSVRLRHNNDYRQSQTITTQNEFQTISTFFNGSGSGNHTEFRMFGLDTKAGDYFYIDYFLLIDLTDSFGKGNEPTKEVMDWIINTNGYFDELTLRRDGLQQYELNQLKKAVLALGGTI